MALSPNTSYSKTLWPRWKQGIVVVAHAYVIMIIAAFPFAVGQRALRFLDLAAPVELLLAFILAFTWFVLVPLLVAEGALDRQAGRAQMVATIEPHVNQL